MKKLIIGNWKMNGDIELFDHFNDELDIENYALGVPMTLLGYAYVKAPKFLIAAQDCSIFSGSGSHTGEISANMLKSLNCKYVILGHSERRGSGESPDAVRIKLKNAIEAGITPILCVDEHFLELLDSETKSIVAHSDTILAYEPLSAIGTGTVPSNDEINEALSQIKSLFESSKPRTLYGGSVNSSNAESILSIPSVDGVLIGGASLKVNEMKKIISYV